MKPPFGWSRVRPKRRYRRRYPLARRRWAPLPIRTQATDAGRRCAGMRRIARENAPCALMALVGSATLAWLGLYGFAWNDYENEARAGLRRARARPRRAVPAPGAGLRRLARRARALCADPRSVGRRRAGCLPHGRAALPARLRAARRLAGRAHARRGTSGASARGRARRCASPTRSRCARWKSAIPRSCSAPACASRPCCWPATERGLWAGIALGLAFANKEWALLGAGPVLLALPAHRRAACAAVAVGVAAAVLAPLALVRSGGFVTADSRHRRGAQSGSFSRGRCGGSSASTARSCTGRSAWPSPAIASRQAGRRRSATRSSSLAGLAPGLGLWLRGRGGRAGVRSALLALALAMLLRCVLDTWDTEYYLLPFVLALLAWELGAPVMRPPVIALSVSVLAWLSFQWLPERVSAGRAGGAVPGLGAAARGGARMAAAANAPRGPSRRRRPGTGRS